MSRGLTQAELGTKVGASQRVVAYYESHEAQPPGAMLFDLAKTLKVTCDELPDDLLANYPSVAWRDIAGARDIVAHEYFRVDLALVWGVVTKDVPRLAEQVRGILREFQSE